MKHSMQRLKRTSSLITKPKLPPKTTPRYINGTITEHAQYTNQPDYVVK